MQRHLPPGLRARTSKTGVTRYYLKIPNEDREIALGADQRLALNQWQHYRLTCFVQAHSVDNLVRLIDCFMHCSVPTREQRARLSLLRQSDTLRQYFLDIGNPKIVDSLPSCEAYLQSQGSGRRHRAGAEVYLFIHIWHWAQAVSLLPAKLACPWRSQTVVTARQHDIHRELMDAIHVLRTASAIESNDRSNHPRHPRQIEAARQEIAAQLVSDGRGDLARHLRSLDSSALEGILSPDVATPSAGPASRLVLSTKRTERLRALRLGVDRNRAERIDMASHVARR